MQSMPECNRRLRRTYLRFIARLASSPVPGAKGTEASAICCSADFRSSSRCPTAINWKRFLVSACYGCHHPVAPHHCRRRHPVLARKLTASRSQAPSRRCRGRSISSTAGPNRAIYCQHLSSACTCIGTAAAAYTMSAPCDDWVFTFALANYRGFSLSDRRGRRRRLHRQIRCICRPAKRDQSVARRNELKAAHDRQSHTGHASNSNNACHEIPRF
jgi:hypothetical protein